MSVIDILSTAGPLLAGAAGLASGARFVQEGERGLKLRFGRVVRDRAGHPKIVQPGFCWLWPSVEHLRRTHVRDRTFNFVNQEVMLADKTVFVVSAVVVVRLQDNEESVYRALFEVDDLSGSVSDYTASILREVLSELNHTEVNDRTRVLSQVHERVTSQLAEWGMDLRRFMLTDCAPTDATARLMLTSAEATFRSAALMDAAKSLGTSVGAMHPSIAAALIGVPVVTALDASRAAGSISSTGGDNFDEEED